jgi:uncharacterized membrane protein YbaN (DUF454 family)
MRYAWLGLGAGSVLMALVAVALPLVPSTPFLLVAAFAFARSSERLHTWLHEHPRLGPPLADWNEGRRVRRGAKWAASISITLAFVLSVALGLKPWVLLVQAVVLSAVVLYIWSRPEPASPAPVTAP